LALTSASTEKGSLPHSGRQGVTLTLPVQEAEPLVAVKLYDAPEQGGGGGGERGRRVSSGGCTQGQGDF
jgi:hypothetical protein